MSTVLIPTTELTDINVNYNSPRIVRVSYPGDTTLNAITTDGGTVSVDVSGDITYIPKNEINGYTDTIMVTCVSKIANSEGTYDESDALVINVTVLPQPDTRINKLETVNVELGRTTNDIVSAITPDTTFRFTVQDQNICKVIDKKIQGVGVGKTMVGFTAVSPTTREVSGTIEVTVFQVSIDSPTTSDGLVIDVTSGKLNRFNIIYDNKTTNLIVSSENGSNVIYNGLNNTDTLEGRYTTLSKIGDNYFKLTGHVVNKDTTETYTLQSVLKDNSGLSSLVELKVNVITNPDVVADDDGDLTTEDLLKLLNNNTPFEEKIKTIKERGSSEVKQILDELDTYRLNILIVDDIDVGCELQMALYDLIVKVLRYITINETKFKVYFSLLNLFFKYHNESFNDTNMHLYLDNWNGRNKKSLQTYKNLAVLLSSLCDITTRQANLNTIDMDSVFDRDTTIFTEVMRDSLVKYYVV